MEFQNFTFEEDGHIYRNARGIARPSVTGSLTSQGVFDFSMVPAAVLDNARRRGKNVHRCTAEYDLYGSVDDTWIAEDEMGYFEAWLKLRRELKPKILAVESPMLGFIGGVEVGGTPDREVYIGGMRYILDLKCCAAKHPGWALQTADYELLRTKRPRCGHLGRMSAQLFPSGKYSVSVYEHASDADAATAAVRLTAWDEQSSWSDADEARETLETWKRNFGLLKAA